MSITLGAPLDGGQWLDTHCRTGLWTSAGDRVGTGSGVSMWTTVTASVDNGLNARCRLGGLTCTVALLTGCGMQKPRGQLRCCAGCGCPASESGGRRLAAPPSVTVMTFRRLPSDPCAPGIPSQIAATPARSQHRPQQTPAPDDLGLPQRATGRSCSCRPGCRTPRSSGGDRHAGPAARGVRPGPQVGRRRPDRACGRAVDSLPRRQGPADERALGDQPEQPLGVVHPGRRARSGSRTGCVPCPAG